MTEQELSTIYNQIKGITIKIEKLNKDSPMEEFNRINRSLQESLYQLNLVGESVGFNIKANSLFDSTSDFIPNIAILEWHDAETDKPEYNKPLIVIQQSVVNGVLMKTYVYSTATYESWKVNGFYGGLKHAGIVKYWAYLTPPEKKSVRIANFYL